jgi:hypothetical protein
MSEKWQVLYTVRWLLTQKILVQLIVFFGRSVRFSEIIFL